MQVIDTQTRLAAVLKDLREKGKSVGLVPTMGAPRISRQSFPQRK